jgi:hypothetical protein
MNRPMHIDQYIKDKVELLDLSYDEIYWTDAEKLILAEEKKKRRFFIILILILIALVGLAIMIIKFQPNTTNQINRTTQKDYIVNTDKNSTVKRFTLFNSTKKNKIINKNSTISKKKSIKKKKSNSINSAGNLTSVSNQLDSIPNLNTNKDIDSVKANDLSRTPIIWKNIESIPSSYNLWLNEEDRKYKGNNSTIVGISAGFTFNRNAALGYLFGLHVQKIHSKKIHSRFGVQFSALQFSDLKYTYTKTEYSFGEIISKYTINSDKLYTIQVPISIHYRFYKHHTLHTGPVYTRYFAQKNIITNTKGAEVKSESEFGQSKDFNMHNIAWQIGYENIFWRRYQLGISTQLSLFNPVNDLSKLTTNKSDMLIESRVYLVYNLMKFKR